MGFIAMEIEDFLAVAMMEQLITDIKENRLKVQSCVGQKVSESEIEIKIGFSQIRDDNNDA